MSNLSSMFGMYNVAIPDEGPKCIRADLDFSSLGSIDIEGLLATTTGTMSYVQGVFIDNRTNDNPIELKCSVTGQIISCPANAQGYFPILITNPPRFVASTTPVAALRVLMFFYNVPIQPMIWGSDGQIITGTVTAIVAGPTIADHSLVMDTTNQIAVTAGQAAHYLAIYNPTGNANVTVNLAGGDATASGIVLVGGGSITIEQGCANAVTVSGANTETLNVFGG